MKIKKTVIFMGYTCNNNCIFCCNSDRRKHVSGKTTEQIKRDLVTSRKKGSNYIELIGGEPTIRGGIFKIVGLAKKLNFHTIVFATNGRMFANKEFTKKIIDAGVNSLIFSIHGHKSKLHDKLTQVPGSFEQLKKGMNNLKELGFTNIGSNTTIVKQNYKQLLNIGKLIYDLGIRNSEFIFVDPTRGLSKTNFDKIVPTYEEVSPYVNKLLEFGKNKKIPHWHIRYYPLCFVEEKYHDMVSELHEKKVFTTEHLAPDFVNRDVEGSRNLARKKIKKCSFCKYSNKCEGYWEEYTKRQNIRNTNPGAVQIPPCKIRAPPQIVGSLPDMMAVKKGIKPLTRICCSNPEEYHKIVEWCKANKLFVEHSKHKILNDDIEKRTYASRCRNLVKLTDPGRGKIHLYISLDPKLCKKVRDSDPEITVKPNEAHVREFGLNLGYPQCCVEEHVSQWRKKASECLDKFRPTQKIPFSMNNLLNCVSNHYLSFHYPCSFQCKKTREYNKKIFNTIKEELPEFATEIKKYLTMPILVWFDNTKSIYPSWDSRRGIIFDGFVVSNELTYKACFFMKPTHPQTNSNFDISPQLFNKGNKIKIHRLGFTLFDNEKEVKNYKTKNRLQSILFKFKK